jgi:hypothetical protein
VNRAERRQAAREAKRRAGGRARLTETLKRGGVYKFNVHHEPTCAALVTRSMRDCTCATVAESVEELLPGGRRRVILEEGDWSP